MAQTTNNNAIDMLDTHIADHEASNPLAARLVQFACGDVSKEDWAAFERDSHEVPYFAFNLASVQKRHKFAASQLIKLFELTYALQVKLALGKAVRDEDKLWIKNPETGELQEVTLKVVKDNKWEAHKLNKNDLNSIRSFYEDQLTKELPKIMHKVYNEFITLKSKHAYNANEVKLVLMNPEFLETALTDVEQYVKDSNVFENSEALQRDFLYDSWFKYTKATGKNTEKIAEYFKKLIQSTISRLAKELAVYRKSPTEAKVSEHDMKAICDMYIKYTEIPMNETMHRYFAAISCDTLFSKMKREYEALNMSPGEALAARVNVALDLRALASLEFVNCNYYLVHLETLSGFKHVKGSVTADQVKKMFTVVTGARFAAACRSLMGKNAADVDYETTVGSERLNTTIFKAIGAHNVATQTAEKTSRRKFSPELEAAIVQSEHFRKKLLTINNGKSSSNSTRSKKQRTEKALILSYEMYQSIEDDELRAAFRDAHAPEGSSDYGLVQKGTMFLSSASKIHDSDSAATIISFENSGANGHDDRNVVSEISENINAISLAVSAYSASLSGKSSKEQDGAIDLAAIAKRKATAKTSTTTASSSPKATAGRSLGLKTAPVKKEEPAKPAGRVVAPAGKGLMARLGANKKPAKEEETVVAEDEVVEEEKPASRPSSPRKDTKSPRKEDKPTSSSPSRQAKSPAREEAASTPAKAGRLAGLLNKKKQG